MHTNNTVALKPNFMSPLLLCAVHISNFITLKTSKLHNKNLKKLLFIFLF